MQKTIRFLLENSMFLIIGTVAALIWANTSKSSYDHLVHMPLLSDTIVGSVPHADQDSHTESTKSDAKETLSDAIDNVKSHDDHPPAKKVIDLHYLINDILMALFFAIAGKEVWEATFPGGPLSNPKRAATPLIATLGGMAGPVLFYVIVAHLGGGWGDLKEGWAIPCATDIAFSYMVARMVFGAGHPAIPFLLLLAIADDALGLIILAVAYPSGPIQLTWLLLSVAAVIIGFVMRKMRIHSFWPYLLVCGTCSWFGFALAGLHPALGLLPIIPTMPHAHVDTGLFDWSKMEKDDTLTHFEHSMKTPVELILGVFGLLNAGVAFSSVGLATSAVVVGLLIGKPFGIFIFGMLGAKVLKFGFPDGMDSKDLFVVGCAGAIGFTVALFITGVAFDKGSVQDAAKMGALFSFGAAIVTIAASKLLRIQKVPGGDKAGHH